MLAKKCDRCGKTIKLCGRLGNVTYRGANMKICKKCKVKWKFEHYH